MLRSSTEVSQAIRRPPATMTNFSTSVNVQTRAKVLAEVRPLLNAHQKCREIWQALQVADYKREGILNDNALEVLFQKQGFNIQDLLLVKNAEELQELLDEDEDGFINEDEQVLLFSIVKERMETLAEQLCEIHEYALYKDLMKSVRVLESDIINYQSILRKRTHEKELLAYREIGQQKLENFENDWNSRFQQFEEQCNERYNELLAQHDDQMDKLNTQLQRDGEFLKFKPKARLRELQIEEKLFAVNERYGEAQKIRNELKYMEDEEQMRVMNRILSEQEKRRQNLLRQQAKEIRQFHMKNDAARNKLKIQKNQEENVLQKAIKLHVNDITKNQNLASRLAHKVGKQRDELRRTKKKTKLMQQYLKDVKATKSKKTGSYSPQEGSNKSPKGGTQVHSTYSAFPGTQRVSNVLKSATKNVTKFNIRSPLTRTTPVNVNEESSNASSLGNKTAVLLQQITRKETLPSLTELYDEHLVEI